MLLSLQTMLMACGSSTPHLIDYDVQRFVLRVQGVSSITCGTVPQG